MNTPAQPEWRRTHLFIRERIDTLALREMCQCLKMLVAALREPIFVTSAVRFLR
ncbi:hypothetical protein J2X72_002288 [Phyllobacterium sp. 1468]|nr:hypothetical protein [Phyllobacterium sp. 1468]